MISIKRLFVTTAIITLTACDSHNFTDLQQYIAEIKARPPEQVKPLPEFKSVEPFIFKKETGLRDPFKPVEKIKVAESAEEEEPDNGIHPDTHRIKEPLEVFSLNGLKMVGTIDMNSTLWGLIKGDGNTIYRVKAGNHMGKNNGKITSIDKKKIELIEIVPSKPGHFIEQSTTLNLTE